MTTTDVSPLFVDTNVLIYATRPASPWHAHALTTLDTMRRSGVELVISPQILREYLAATTRPASDGSATPLADALANVAVFRGAFRLVDEHGAVVSALETLLSQIAVVGRQVHDANIVATMQAHGVARLLTHNVTDFTRFAHLITIIPLEP